MQAAASGDTTAQHELLQRTLPIARNTARRLLGRSQEEEDAVQATMLAVLRSASRFRGQSSLATWVTRIGTRITLRLMSKQRVLVPAESVESVPAPSPTESRTDELPRPVSEYLDRLPSPQRVAIVLRYGQDYAVDDIAAATGTSRNTVKYRLKTAVATVRRLVRQDLTVRGRRNDG
jgi:RNA polymerase sigma-70 factor (ECF subfamily)